MQSVPAFTLRGYNTPFPIRHPKQRSPRNLIQCLETRRTGYKHRFDPAWTISTYGLTRAGVLLAGSGGQQKVEQRRDALSNVVRGLDRWKIYTFNSPTIASEEDCYRTRWPRTGSSLRGPSDRRSAATVSVFPHSRRRWHSRRAVERSLSVGVYGRRWGRSTRNAALGRSRRHNCVDKHGLASPRISDRSDVPNAAIRNGSVDCGPSDSCSNQRYHGPYNRDRVGNADGILSRIESM